WLPDRHVVLVADSAFAAIEFLAAVRNHVCVVTRLRLDANLFDFPPQKRKGRGRRPIKGKPLKKLSAIIKDRKVSWQRYRVSLWYGRTNRVVEIASGTAIWYRGGVPPVLLGLFSIVTLWAHDLSKSRKLKPRTAAWYPKAVVSFSDAIAAVRREIWAHQISF